MSSVPHGLAGTSSSGDPLTLDAVDTTRAAPVINSTARDVQVAASVMGEPNALVGDASTARIKTGAGFFKFINGCLYFPWGQRLCGAGVRAAGIGAPIWHLLARLAQVGVLHPLFSPGLAARITQVGAVVGRFVPGYWIGPGTIAAMGSVLSRFNPGTYLTPDAVLELVGSIAGRFIPAVHLAADIIAAGAVVGRFVQGFFLAPDAVITAAGNMIGHRVPALDGVLALQGAVGALYLRGRQFFVTLHLVGSLRHGLARVLGTTLTVAGALGPVAIEAMRVAQIPLQATLRTGRELLAPAQDAALALASMLDALRARLLDGTLTLSGTVQAVVGAHLQRVLDGTLTLSGAMQTVLTALRRQFLDGSLALSGAVQTLLGRLLQSSLTLSGVVQTLRMPGFLSTVQAVGALAHAAVRGLPGNVHALGALLRQTTTTVSAATLTVAGVLGHVIGATEDAALEALGSLAGRFVPGLAATITAAGTMASSLIPALSAQVQLTGAVVGRFVQGYFLSDASSALSAALRAWQSGKVFAATLTPSVVLRLYQSVKALVGQLRTSAFIVVQYLFSSGASWSGGGTTSATDTESWRGGGQSSTTDSRSWQGGGTASSPDARSWQGGGTASRLDTGSWAGGTTIAAQDTGSWAGGTTVATRDTQAWGGGVQITSPRDAQAWGGGLQVAAPRDAGSWSGGAVAGTINPAHTRGYFVGGVAPDLGGNVNAVPLWLSSGGGSLGGQRAYAGPGGFAFGSYVKMPAYTANGTVLWDLWLGTIGYTRCSIGNTGVIKAELSYTDINVSSTSFTTTSGSFAVPLNQWVWIWMRQYASGNGFCPDGNVMMHLQVGWNWVGGQSSSDASTGNWCASFNVLYWGQLGVGVPLSPTTSYDPFPNTAGYEMSKFRYQPSGNPAFSPPTIDATAGNYGIVYNARQPAGVATSLVDTGSQWNGVPGAQGLTVYTDGPYP